MEGNRIIKSVFKYNVYEEIYYLESHKRSSNNGYYLNPDVRSETKFLERKILFECELDSPPLRTGEPFYINELDKTIVISDGIRCSDGGIIYLISDYSYKEVIKTDNTTKSLTKAEEELKVELIKYNEWLVKENEEKRKILEPILGNKNSEQEQLKAKKKWWQFRK